MKIECQIHKKQGMPLTIPIAEDVIGYHCANGDCMVDCASGQKIHLTDAHITHSNTIRQENYVLGLSIHGIEQCPELHGAGVSQVLWLRIHA